LRWHFTVAANSPTHRREQPSRFITGVTKPTMKHKHTIKAQRPTYDHLPRTGTNLTRASHSREFILIYRCTDDVLAFRYFMRRVHGWQSVMNCICDDHGLPNKY
jgi:hypothetical protein